jgi:hypothetical protein
MQMMDVVEGKKWRAADSSARRPHTTGKETMLLTGHGSNTLSERRKGGFWGLGETSAEACGCVMGKVVVWC